VEIPVRAARALAAAARALRHRVRAVCGRLGAA
jgi:hypothetical protein